MAGGVTFYWARSTSIRGQNLRELDHANVRASTREKTRDVHGDVGDSESEGEEKEKQNTSGTVAIPFFFKITHKFI
jgi:hypothetical protein